MISGPLRIRSLARRLAEQEIWFVALAVAASFLSTRFLPLAVGIAAVFWPLRWLACGRLSRPTPADWGMAGLFLMVPVTLWVTIVPETTWLQVYRLLTGLALFYAIVNWAVTPARLYGVLAGLALVSLSMAALAPFSVMWPSGKLPFLPAGLFESFRVLVSDSVHPNVLAGSLAILMPFPLAIVLFGWPWPAWRLDSRRLRLLAGLIVVVSALVLVLTQSRGAWLGFGLAAMLMAVLRWRRGWLLMLLGLVAGGAAIYLLGLKSVFEMLVASSSVTTLDGRQEIWSRAIYMIQDFPLTGVGMGTFGHVADLLYPFFFAAPGLIAHAHNIFLQVAVDLGLPGLIAWLSVFGLAIVAAGKLYRAGHSHSQTWALGLGAALICSQLALVTHGMVDAVVWGMVKPAPLVWAIWGLAIAGWMVISRPDHATM